MKGFFLVFLDNILVKKGWFFSVFGVEWFFDMIVEV